MFCHNAAYLGARDLNVWPDDVSNDDPTQPPGTDLKVLQAIMASAYNISGGNKMIHISGFVPWAYKYVQVRVGQHFPLLLPVNIGAISCIRNR